MKYFLIILIIIKTELIFGQIYYPEINILYERFFSKEYDNIKHKKIYISKAQLKIDLDSGCLYKKGDSIMQWELREKENYNENGKLIESISYYDSRPKVSSTLSYLENKIVKLVSYNYGKLSSESSYIYGKNFVRVEENSKGYFQYCYNAKGTLCERQEYDEKNHLIRKRLYVYGNELPDLKKLNGFNSVESIYFNSIDSTLSEENYIISNKKLSSIRKVICSFKGKKISSKTEFYSGVLVSTTSYYYSKEGELIGFINFDPISKSVQVYKVEFEYW